MIELVAVAVDRYAAAIVIVTPVRSMTVPAEYQDALHGEAVEQLLEVEPVTLTIAPSAGGPTVPIVTKVLGMAALLQRLAAALLLVSAGVDAYHQ